MLKLKDSFLVIVFIACFTCFSRADYNLILFAFAYILWDREEDQKSRLVYLFVYSAIIDLVWLIYWLNFWERSEFDKNWSKGVHHFVEVLSFIEFAIKIIIIVLCLLKEPICALAFTPVGLQQNLSSCFGTDNNKNKEYQEQRDNYGQQQQY